MREIDRAGDLLWTPGPIARLIRTAAMRQLR
jgi:hypothetical protein